LAQHSFDPPVGPPGDQRLLSPHNKPVKTADGWISFTINTDAQVRAFLKATDRHALLEDARFATVAARAKHVMEWFEVRGAPLPDRTTKEWLEILREADIAAKPCHTLESLRRDPHLEAVDLVRFEEHPTEGKTAAIRSTIRFDDSYPSLRTPSQPRGWETCEVLEEIGCSSAEIEELLAEGAAVRAVRQ
jgi:crotonobetainyl-CoA:carnitine CoA-transferase CaiB-like acyl-CoA transferase